MPGAHYPELYSAIRIVVALQNERYRNPWPDNGQSQSQIKRFQDEIFEWPISQLCSASRCRMVCSIVVKSNSRLHYTRRKIEYRTTCTMNNPEQSRMDTLRVANPSGPALKFARSAHAALPQQVRIRNAKPRKPTPRSQSYTVSILDRPMLFARCESSTWPASRVTATYKLARPLDGPSESHSHGLAGLRVLLRSAINFQCG